MDLTSVIIGFLIGYCLILPVAYITNAWGINSWKFKDVWNAKIVSKENYEKLLKREDERDL